MGNEALTGSGRPRVLILADRPGSVHGEIALRLAALVGRKFTSEVGYGSAAIEKDRYDLLHAVCWWDEAWLQAGFAPARVLLQIVSPVHGETGEAWSACAIADRYASHAAVLIASGEDVHQELALSAWPMRRLDLGSDPAFFHPAGRRAADLSFGYVSGARRWPARLKTMLQGASLRPGADPEARRAFFRGHDVVIVTGEDAWSRLCVVEAMACGAFVIAGRHAADLVINGVSGLVIGDDAQEIESAMAWCRLDPGAVTDGAAWASQEAMIRRNWSVIGSHYAGILWGRWCTINSTQRKAA